MGVVLPQPIQFGKYMLFERIGRGGMADVFKGRVQGPAGFERVFVVKRILPHLCDDPQFTRMFIEEAKLSSRLNHPNIVQVFELGAVDKEYFIAMEYVRGRDLAETMRTLWARVGPPRAELVAYVGREMCRALAYAHDLTGDDGELLGMIHRDVSPSNVMLSYEGAVKLLDFGIAKALGGESQVEEGNTQRGTLKGKFAYMAPEQTQGNDVDRRIDIFATGIVLHEVLTGRRLFKGENDLQTVERVRVCEVAPPSVHNPLCPPELDGIILRALARNRDERFQTSSEMADALDDVVHAARFQPTHLAMLMRELFPTDAGGTGVTRTTGSVPGTQSRPHSTMRSPTVPPVSVRSPPPNRPSLPRLGHVPTPPPRRGFFARGSTWGALALVALGVGVGAMVSRTSTREASSVGPSETAALPRKFSVKVSSIPDGASIYLFGENKYLGTTDTYLQFNLKKDEVFPSLLIKKEGYREEIKQVNPYSILIQLRRIDSSSQKPGEVERPVGEQQAPPGSNPSSAPTPGGPPQNLPSRSLSQPSVPTTTSAPLNATASDPETPAHGSAKQAPTPNPTRRRERDRNRQKSDPNRLHDPF